MVHRLMIISGCAPGWLAWQVIDRDRVVERGQVPDRSGVGE
jgi:hypothetical protein